MTTDLEIHGREYDLEGATSRVELNVLVFMNKRLGITLKQIVGGLQALTAVEDPMDLLSDEAGIDSIRGLIWLIRTSAGERGPDGKFFTLDEASDGISFTDLHFLNQETATGTETAPKELTGAANPS